MAPLLLLLALLAGGTAYYEFNWHEQSSEGFQSQIQNWESRLGQLKSENKKLNEDKLNLARQLEQAREAYLASMAQRAALAHPASVAPKPPPAPPKPLPSPGGTSLEDMGTFTTITGKTYQSARLLKIEATDIVISSAEGITQIPYVIMPPDMQKKFGWDPQKSSAENAAVIRYQEELEQAKEDAAADGDNTTPATPPPNPNMVPGMVPAPGASNP
jgi:hypothetical protein